MKRIIGLVVLGLSGIHSIAHADSVTHYNYWSRNPAVFSGEADQKVGADTQCFIYNKLEYEWEGAQIVRWMQGLRDGERIQNLDWQYGVTRHTRKKKKDDLNQPYWTDDYGYVTLDWKDTIDGYLLAPGCSLLLTTETNFAGAKEIVVPRPDDTRAWTGNESINDLDFILPKVGALHATQALVSSIACLCEEKAPSPMIPAAAPVLAVRESVSKANQALQDVTKVARDLDSGITLLRSRLQTFQERASTFGDMAADLTKVADMAGTISRDELNAMESKYRAFGQENCTASPIGSSFESLAALEKKGTSLLTSYRTQFDHMQDGTSTFRQNAQTFVNVRKKFKAERPELTKSYNAFLRKCQLVSNVLEGIPKRIRYEKLTKMTASFISISDEAIQAIEAANLSLQRYSVKLYWDSEFTKRLNALSAFRLGSYMNRMDQYSLEVAEWFVQFRESIKADPTVKTEAEAIALLAPYEKMLRDEKVLYNNKRALGSKVLVSGRVENLFNLDLLSKVRKAIHASPDADKQALIDFYASAVENSGFTLPNDCKQKDLAVRNSACWKISINATSSEDVYDAYDVKLDELEDALRAKFSL